MLAPSRAGRAPDIKISLGTVSGEAVTGTPHGPSPAAAATPSRTNPSRALSRSRALSPAPGRAGSDATAGAVLCSGGQRGRRCHVRCGPRARLRSRLLVRTCSPSTPAAPSAVHGLRLTLAGRGCEAAGGEAGACAQRVPLPRPERGPERPPQDQWRGPGPCLASPDSGGVCCPGFFAAAGPRKSWEKGRRGRGALPGSLGSPRR